MNHLQINLQKPQQPTPPIQTLTTNTTLTKTPPNNKTHTNFTKQHNTQTSMHDKVKGSIMILVTKLNRSLSHARTRIIPVHYIAQSAYSFWSII